MDFQKYNIKEKKKKEKRKEKEKKENKATRIILKTPKTTTQRLYTVFALKNRVFFFEK